MKKILFIATLLAIGSNCFGAEIHRAARKGRLEVVKRLIKKNKKNIEAKDKQGHTPLYVAAVAKKLDVVKYLIEDAKANVEGSPKKLAPLVWACITARGNLDVVKYLVEKGKANIDGNNSESPLYQVITYEREYPNNNHFETIKYLVKKHANITDEDINAASKKVKKYLEREKEKRKEREKGKKIGKKDLEERADFLLEGIKN